MSTDSQEAINFTECLQSEDVESGIAGLFEGLSLADGPKSGEGKNQKPPLIKFEEGSSDGMMIAWDEA